MNMHINEYIYMSEYKYMYINIYIYIYIYTYIYRGGLLECAALIIFQRGN